MLRVLIADEHDVTRQGVRVHLEAQQGWQVVGEAAEGKQAIHAAIDTKPDVAVLAYELPIANGIDVTARIRERLPNTEVVIYTARNIENLLADLLRAGVIQAIKAVAARKLYFNDMESLRRIQDMSQEARSSLSPRERSVIQ